MLASAFHPAVGGGSDKLHRAWHWTQAALQLRLQGLARRFFRFVRLFRELERARAPASLCLSRPAPRVLHLRLAPGGPCKGVPRPDNLVQTNANLRRAKSYLQLLKRARLAPSKECACCGEGVEDAEALRETGYLWARIADTDAFAHLLREAVRRRIFETSVFDALQRPGATNHPNP